MPAGAAEALQGGSLAVWTTTPWTMPANMAVAVNARMVYAAVRGPVRGPRPPALPHTPRPPPGHVQHLFARLDLWRGSLSGATSE